MEVVIELENSIPNFHPLNRRIKFVINENVTFIK